MFVRQLIGRQAGVILEMPYHAATANIAAGTCAQVTDNEISEAGFDVQRGTEEAKPEGLPEGYTTTADAEGFGVNLFDPDGNQINEQPLKNLVVARSLAWNDLEELEDADDDIESMKVVELRKFAADKNISLTDCRSKADIVAAINAAIENQVAAPTIVEAADGQFVVLGSDGKPINTEPLSKEDADALLKSQLDVKP